MKRTGWHNESARHSLAAKGVKTGSAKTRKEQMFLDALRKRSALMTTEPTGYEDESTKSLKDIHKSLTRQVEGEMDSLSILSELQLVGEELSRRGVKSLNARGKKSKSSVSMVSEISEDLMFVSDSQEVMDIKDSIGTKDVKEFDSFFIRVGDGDYDEVWGMQGIVPWKNKEVWRVK